MIAFFIAVVAVLLVFGFVEAELPSGFRDEGVVYKNSATAFNFVPKADGGQMLFICSKSGELVASPNPNTDTTSQLVNVLDLRGRVCSNGERGLQSVLAHPNFLQNRWIYLYFTFDKFGGCGLDSQTGAVNRLSRFIVDENDLTIDVSTEVVLLETSPLPNKLHNGGDMKFGNDGYLYLTIGDGGASDNEEPQNLSFLLGSLIRITDTGGIPPGNPYVGSGTARCNTRGRGGANIKCQEIFARGLRNPFRMALKPDTSSSVTELWINDVGGSKWEEINRAGSAFSGANYGYREREGPCRVGSLTNCDPENSYVDPIYWYQHNQDEEAAITGGAFVPGGIWPGEYDNTYLYSDFIFQKVFALRANDAKACRNCNPPRPGYISESFFDLSNIGRPVQLTFGPYFDTQALYYIVRDSNGTNVRRIIYEGGANKRPEAVIQVSTMDGLIGTEIEFNGFGSTDPEGDVISYSWDFGDGASSGQRRLSHTYGASGNYRVSLTVTDGNGFQSVDFVTIRIGNPPRPTIDAPAEGTKFAVGDIFKLSGSAVDGQGNSLPSTSLTWEVRQQHGSHWHPFLDPTTGTNIVIDPAPPPEDFQASQNSFLTILLTATDSNGLSSTVELEIRPKIVTLQFSSDPSGLELVVDGFPLTTPAQAVFWENHNLELRAANQSMYSFVSWSDGGANTHMIRVPRNNVSFLATFSAQCVMAFGPCAVATDCCSNSCALGKCRKVSRLTGSKQTTSLSPKNQHGGAPDGFRGTRVSGRRLRREPVRGG